MSKENAARRNRALRKIRKAKHVDPEIKLAIEAILDLLSPKSDYEVAWPSAMAIAKRLRRSRRTGQWYVKIIKQLDIFHCVQLPPPQLRAFFKQKYGFQPKLDKCVTFAPNLYIVNPKNPLWDATNSLPDSIDRKMGEIVSQVKAQRNLKTTSCLAKAPANRPNRANRKTRDSTYSLGVIRLRLQETRKALRDDDANDDILRQEEAERWCREELLDDVANFTIDGVANDVQGFKRFSCEDDFVFSSPEARQKEAATVLSVIPSPKGSAVRQPCSQGLRADAPPTRRIRHGESRVKQFKSVDQDEKLMAPAGSECRFAPGSLVGSGFAALAKPRRTAPVRHKVSEQGVGRIDGELLVTMKRQKSKRAEKERRLIALYANRPDAAVLGSISLTVQCPPFSSGRAQGCP